MIEMEPNLNPFGTGEPDYSEHHAPSHSKKVTMAPFAVPAEDDTATPVVSRAPVQKAISAVSQEWDVLPNSAYRIAATVDVYFRLSSATSAAIAGDMFLPALTPMTVLTGRYFKKLSAIRVSTDGAMQVLKVE